MLLNLINRFVGSRLISTRIAARSATVPEAIGERAFEPCFESMETRLLLAVSALEFGQIRALYPDLKLSASMSSYNVIEIGPSESALRSAIATAATTTKPDLIVVRTTGELWKDTVKLSGEISINISAKSYGSVTIVVLGGGPLVLDADARMGRESRVFSINGSVVGLGGITIQGGWVSGEGISGEGGGILNRNSLLTVTESTIISNTASYGGGIMNRENSTLIVTWTTVSGNSASSGSGGGIYNGNVAVLSVMSSKIAGNSARNDGGGICDEGQSWVTNSLFTGNGAAYGGGIYHRGHYQMTVTNCTITGNGSGIYLKGSSMLLTNSIVLDSIFRSLSALSGYNNLTPFYEWSNGYYRGGNIMPFGHNPFGGSGYQLAENSLAIDKGSAQFAKAAGLTSSSRDLAGNPRIVGGAIDIGAYEYQSTSSEPLPAFALVSELGWQSVILSWAKVSAGEIHVEWYSGKTMVGNMTVSGGTFAVEITGLNPGVKYSFRVYTVSGGKPSKNYASVTATTPGIPGPQSARGKASDVLGAVELAWQPPKAADLPADLTLIGYHIYNAARNAPATPVAFVPAVEGTMSYRVEGLTPNTSCSYRIVAVYQKPDGVSTIESTKTVTVKAKTKSFAAPKLLKTTAADRTLNSVTLRWQPSDDATGFAVTCQAPKKLDVPLNFAEGGNAKWLYENNDSVNGRIIGVKITGLAAGVKYSVSVTAISDRVSVPSAMAKRSVATVKFTGTKKPSLVRNSLLPDAATLTWKPTVLPQGVAEGSVVYEVYYSETKLKPNHPTGWTRIASTADGAATGLRVTLTETATAVEAILEGLTPGRLCYIHVRSIWIDGNGNRHEATVFSLSGVVTFRMPA